MEALSDVLSSKKWDLPAQHPTFAIGLSFIFLAYFLHPRIEGAYQRVRASRAWRTVQKHGRVDVTDYPMLKETFGISREWDAARTVTVLLAAFSLVSWVLELSLDIYHVHGAAHLLTQPPPVYKYYQDTENLTWEVLPPEKLNPEYGGVWQDLDNMDDNEAKSRYYVEDYREYAWSKKIDTYKNGEIVVASWDKDKKPDLSYGQADKVKVGNISCTGAGDPLVDASVNLDSVEWGRVLECGEGPKADTQAGGSSQPAMILTESSTGKVYVIVEEVGAHPSFLYSVWTAADDSSGNLDYSFHLASTVRLAEAVVTGIVNGHANGGGCFGLLRAFSRGDDTVDTSTDIPPDSQRAKPFGEKPKRGRVESLQDVETLEAGVLMNTNALVAFVCLLLLSVIGIGWSMCLKSSYDIDVYDRDELLRAVSQQAQGETNDPSKRSAMRIYVEKEGDDLKVVLSESFDDYNGCVRFLLRREPTTSVHPVPVANTVGGALGAPLPLGRPRFELMGVRMGMGRPLPGRRNNYQYPASLASSVALSVSPVPSALPTPILSAAGSAAGTPAPRARTRRGLLDVHVGSPVHSLAGSSTCTPFTSNPVSSAAGTPLAALQPPRSPGFLSSFGPAGGGRGVGGFGVAGRGASILFDSVNTFGDDDGSSSSGGGETDRDGSADIERGSGGALGRIQVSAFGGDGSADIEMGRGGALGRPHASAFGGGGSADIETGSGALSRPRAPTSNDVGSGDVETASLGSLQLVRPQMAAFASGQGGHRAQRDGSSKSCAQAANTFGAPRGSSDGDIGGPGDDILHFPSDRTTPPASPGPSPPP